MSAPYYGVSHIETLDALPPELERGRAYFIDSEGYIVIDHGHGPVIYGNRPGPAGKESANSEYVQEQIDYLTEAVFNILTEIARMSNSYDSAINILAQTISKLYPESHSSEWQDENLSTSEILTTESGEQYTIINERFDDGFYICQLETQDESTARRLAETLKAGDTVQVDNTEWVVVSASVENGFVITELAK